MFEPSLQVLFLGDLLSWLKVAQAIVDAPNTSLEVHRAASLRDALHSLLSRRWDALLVDFSDASSRQFLSVPRMYPEHQAIPVVAMIPEGSMDMEKQAKLDGASAFIRVQEISAHNLQGAVLSAIESKKKQNDLRDGGPRRGFDGQSGGALYPSTRIEAISHALNNLLCVISANADILADQMDGSQNAVRSIAQIKEATKNAASLTRHLK